MMLAARRVVRHGHTSIFGISQANSEAMMIAACVAAVVFGVVAVSVPPRDGKDATWWQHLTALVVAFAAADLAFFAVFLPMTL